LQAIQYTADDDRRAIEPLVRLAMADATFYEGNELALIDARNLYLDFVTLYGDHELAPYAQFQAGVCSLEQVVNPAKDQTMTYQAIDDLRVVERRWPDSQYAEAAQSMRMVAGANLADHDYQVGRFYMKRKAFIAAADRFRSVLERFPEYERSDRVYLWLGRALLKMDSEAEARVYLDKLISDYPGGELAHEAQKFLDEAGGKLDM
jgi:outer membrane protein assembly factor BamD